ncbi:hypothetical protein FRC03_001050 [Tulasnella sp. 419]|nr:hypothetical protein FRC03_001050 [Tulasnella sp. 419]
MSRQTRALSGLYNIRNTPNVSGGALADGQIKMYKQAMEEWDRIIPIMQRIRVDV